MVKIWYPDQVKTHPKVMLVIRLTRPKYTGGFAICERLGLIPAPGSAWVTWGGM